MATKVWGKPGAWAQDVEENEALQASKNIEDQGGDFPSLAASTATKPKKKNSKQTLSLSEFTTGTHIGPGAKSRSAHHAESKGLTTDEMMMLPTGPRQRTSEELEQAGLTLGGGFRSYGMQTRDREPNRDFGRSKREGFEGEEPSRADTSDHWGSGKAFVPSNDRHSDDRRGGPGAGGGSYGRDFVSKADEADDWGAGKKFTPCDRKLGGRGADGGFADGSHSRADESDNWASNKTVERRSVCGAGFESHGEPDGRDRWSRRASEGSFPRGGRSAFDFFQRDAGGPDGDRWARRDENVSGGGGGLRSAERPRLVLQPRRATVSGSEGGPVGIAVGPVGEVAAVAKHRSTNPFGEARPREEVLAEKGQDPKKVDGELGSRGRKLSDGGCSVADRSVEGSGVKERDIWRGNSPVDGGSERDWRKRDSAENGQSSRPEESFRGVNGREFFSDDYVYVEVPRSPSNGNDLNELTQTDKELEQLTNDVGHKVCVSHSDVGCDKTARW